MSRTFVITGATSGLGLAAARALGQQGHRMIIPVRDHLAHFLLTALLLPHLEPGARVVFTGSGSHDTRDFWSRAFLFRGARYTSARQLAEGQADARASVAQQGRDRYSTSKLCNITTALALARRIPVTRAAFFAFDPGLVPGTGLARDNSAFNQFMWRTFVRWTLPGLPGASTAERSGASLAWLLSDPALAGLSGRYYDYRRKETPASDVARDARTAVDLFATSAELCGLDPHGFDAPR